MRIGILGALNQEIDLLVPEMQTDRIETFSNRHYHQGKLWGVPSVLVFSHWGKVAAASTVATLISKFQVDGIVFTGVAGGVAPHLHIGDVIVGSRFVQHDLDARPVFERYEVPLLGKTRIPATDRFTEALMGAARRYLQGEWQSLSTEVKSEFGFDKRLPQLYSGEIASGDQFFSNSTQLHELRQRLPDTLCVEMEGAAVAQVCLDADLPFGIVRTISDSADDEASPHYLKFIQSVSSRYSLGILRELFQEPGKLIS